VISFALSDDQQIIQDTVRKFAAEELRPRMREFEQAGAVPDALRKKFHELGLALLDAPEDCGGQGLGAVTAVLVHEELAAGDPGCAVALWAPHTAAAAILELGDDAQRKRWLPRFAQAPGRLGAVAWSETGKPPEAGFAATATAKGDQFVLAGKKSFVVNAGAADLTVVFAQVEAGKGWDGAGAFVIEGAGTARAGARHQLLGLETVQASELVLDGVTVPAQNRLLGSAGFGAATRRFFDRVALMNASRQVGLARAAYELALAYTQDRHAFGKPVAHFQSIAFTLADMHMDVESARWLVWRAAADLDAARPSAKESIAQAAVHANEAAWRVADNAVQLLGGAGFIQDFAPEKWLRDTKALALFSPTDQMHRLAIAAGELAEAETALPQSDVQPIFT
jgi:acyl-CoA dehydrogenase